MWVWFPGPGFKTKIDHGGLQTKLYDFIFKVTKKKLIEKLEQRQLKPDNVWNITENVSVLWNKLYIFRARP